MSYETAIETTRSTLICRLSLYLFLQQIATYESFYPKFQDFFMEIRKCRKDEDVRITQRVLERWEKTLVEIDKVHRDRLFILIVAAEKGWKVAADVAFGMKGEYNSFLISET